jgi:tRNA A37 threonylcarbamoyladenosine dehydratase
MTVNPIFQRLTLLTGTETVAALEQCRVIVVGLGGVGSWCAEALVRSGVGKITLVDSDTICLSNINRLAQDLGSTVGRYKT